MNKLLGTVKECNSLVIIAFLAIGCSPHHRQMALSVLYNAVESRVIEIEVLSLDCYLTIIFYKGDVTAERRDK